MTGSRTETLFVGTAPRRPCFSSRSAIWCRLTIPPFGLLGLRSEFRGVNHNGLSHLHFHSFSLSFLFAVCAVTTPILPWRIVYPCSQHSFFSAAFLCGQYQERIVGKRLLDLPRRDAVPRDVIWFASFHSNFAARTMYDSIVYTR